MCQGGERERERKLKEREEARGRGKIDGVVDKGSWRREIRWKKKDREGQAMENQLESNSMVRERERGRKLEKIVKSLTVPRLFFPCFFLFFLPPLNAGDVACLWRGEGTQFGTIYSAVFSLIYLRDRE